MLYSIIVLIAGAFIFLTGIDASHAAGEWAAASKASGEIKRQRRSGNIVASLQCRNSPGAKNFLKPQVKFVWKVNTSDTAWTALLFKGVNNWKPGARPGDEKQWRRISSNRVVVASSGARFTCALWYHKHLKASDSNAHKTIYAKASGGFRTMRWF